MLKNLATLLFQGLFINYHLFLLYLSIAVIITNQNSIFSAETIEEIKLITSFDTFVVLSQLALCHFLYLVLIFLIKHKITRFFILCHGLGFFLLIIFPFLGMLFHFGLWRDLPETVLFYDLGMLTLFALTLLALTFMRKKAFTLYQIYKK